MTATVIEVLAIGIALVPAIPTAVLLAEAIAAVAARDRPLPLAVRRPKIAVLVPAHDEAGGIAATVRHLRDQLADTDRLVVVADNCTDATADLAREAGAEVVVRHDPERTGKGFALDAGLAHLAAAPPDVVVVIDADCRITERGIEKLARTAVALRRPVQGRDLMVAGERAGAAARLAEFAWRVKNDLRPTGLARLGLPCQLMGTGMAIPWELIGRVGFATGHVAEDVLLGLDYAAIGRAPRYLPDVTLLSPFPETDSACSRQKARWVHGHLGAIRERGLSMLVKSLKERNKELFAMVVDLMVPPLAILAALHLFALVLAGSLTGFTGQILPLVVAMAGALGFAGFFAVAWGVCGRDLVGRAELREIPRHLARVIRAGLDLAAGKGSAWVRAERSGPE